MLLKIATIAALALGLGGLTAHAMPADQREFLEIVERAKVGAKPDMPDTDRMAILDLRGRWLCQKFRSPSVVDWLGTVWFVEKSPDGMGTLGIAIADGVSVETWAGNTLGVMEVEKSMIPANSALAKDVAGLKPGDKVRFSGRLFQANNGDRCFESMATPSDLMSPAFIMQFRSVQRTSEGPVIKLPQKKDAMPAARTLPKDDRANDSTGLKAEAESFFNALCSKTDQYHGTCEEEQREFVQNYIKAFKGEYTPQRNVGFMLYTGSGGAIRKNPIQACAWRMVVLQSGHPQMDTGDTGNADLACKRLSASERTAAAARTVAIMGEIAGGRGRK